MYELSAICIGAATTSAILIIEHFVCWNMSLHRVIRYSLGVAAIFVGLLVTAALLTAWLIVISFTACAGGGGAVVAGLYLWRVWRGDTTGEENDVFEAGKLAARAEEPRGGYGQTGKPTAGGD